MSNYNLAETLSPEKYREIQRLLDLKTGENVKNGCGKTKCPCRGISENCPQYMDRDAQAARLEQKTAFIDTYDNLTEIFKVDWTMPFVLSGA